MEINRQEYERERDKDLTYENELSLPLHQLAVLEVSNITKYLGFFSSVQLTPSDGIIAY